MPKSKKISLVTHWAGLENASPPELRESFLVYGRRIEDVAIVERVLQKHKAVKEAGCCPRTVGQKRHLFAHILTKDGVDLTPEIISELRDLADEELPGWARPARYKWALRLPHHPDGRVDHRKLTSMSINALNKGLRQPSDKRKRDFREDLPGVELLDPVNKVYFEGSLAGVRAVEIMGVEGVIFQVRHREHGRACNASFWTSRPITLQFLEDVKRGAHLSVEGRIRAGLGGRLSAKDIGSGNLIECTAVQEVEVRSFLHLEDLEEVLGAMG